MPDARARCCLLVGLEQDESIYAKTLLHNVYGNELEYVEAESGSDGLISCLDNEIDFVFAHYHLMDFDALEFTEQLRQADTLLIPLFLLVKSEHEQLAKHAVACGADDYFIISDPDHRYPLRSITMTVNNYALQRKLKREEQKIRAARVLIDQANQTRDDFLSTMSHEIRTPLNGVVGVSELMMHTELNEEQMDYVQTIAGSSETLMRIIDDILDYSKLESGKLTVEEKPFSLRDTIEDAVDFVLDKARTKGLETACLIYPNVPDAVVGDPERISQVLRNLLSNAVKFTKEGVVSLDVCIESEASRQVELRFIVGDTGIGLPAEQREKIFKPFLQANQNASRDQGGTGLGLSISRQLVGMLGGHIGIDSSEGVGTNCWFTLPLKLREIDDFDSDYDFTGKRVLLVDDNATSLFVLSRQLEFLGMQCTAIETSHTAIDVLLDAAEKGEAFDLALIDLNMPDPDGWVLAQRIRRDVAIKDTPLVLISATPKHFHHEQALAAGYNTCMAKPAREKTLKETIARALQGERELRTDLIVKRQQETSRRERMGSSHAHVLLVEDNIINQKVGMRMLRKLGCTVDVVTNGQEAIDALENPEKYNLVFMDCQMPIMDGYEATRVIRQISPAHKELPIVALTANAMNGDRQLCLEAGMNDHIGKPIQLDSLFKVVETWTEGVPVDL